MGSCGHTQRVQLGEEADQVPQAWLDLTGSTLAGVPAVVLIALATLLAAGVVLRWLPA